MALSKHFSLLTAWPSLCISHPPLPAQGVQNKILRISIKKILHLDLQICQYLDLQSCNLSPSLPWNCLVKCIFHELPAGAQLLAQTLEHKSNSGSTSTIRYRGLLKQQASERSKPQCLCTRCTLCQERIQIFLAGDLATGFNAQRTGSLRGLWLPTPVEGPPSLP